jgi:dihydrofolate synthase/folylpolyglutamate synthase
MARENAGVLRKQGLMVTLSQHPEANQTLSEVAPAREVRRIGAAEYIPSRAMNLTAHAITIQFRYWGS